tara:strand:- start:291 stop:665 length:375 start_codon:yes stop_codon:yes gene_type:complete
MILKSNKYLLLKNNLRLILNTMVPGDNCMPYFTKAVKVESIIKRLNKNKFFNDLKRKKIDLSKKENWDNCVKTLGNDILEAYFTSNSVIKALNLRKKNYLKNVKKENMTKLLKKLNSQKKYYRK